MCSKGKKGVPIPPLGLVDDLLTISTCGYKTTLMNKYISSKTGMKKLHLVTDPEYFAGNVKMVEHDAQLYLGDPLSARTDKE